MKKTIKEAKPARAEALSIDPEGLRADQVMRSDLLTLHPDEPIESAVALLEEHHVSGAPVVDTFGRLLGVLSASDVAQRGHVATGLSDHDGGGARFPSLDDELEGADLEEELLEREGYSPAVEEGIRVQDWMTHGLVSVAPRATLGEVCRTMLTESIHRVFVVEEGKLRGVVSAFDVVRVVAGSGPEPAGAARARKEP